MGEQDGEPALDLAPIASCHVRQILRQVWVIDFIEQIESDQFGRGLQPCRFVAFVQNAEGKCLRRCHQSVLAARRCITPVSIADIDTARKFKPVRYRHDITPPRAVPRSPQTGCSPPFLAGVSGTRPGRSGHSVPAPVLPDRIRVSTRLLRLRKKHGNCRGDDKSPFVEYSVPHGERPGSAYATDDYATASGTLTFTPGQTSKHIYISIVDDSVDEPEQYFDVYLSNVSGASLTSNWLAQVDITDNDPTPTVSLSTSGSTEGESSDPYLQIDITLSGASDYIVEIPVSFTGTATLDSDFGYMGGDDPIYLYPGETSSFLLLYVYDDSIDEADETVIFTLGTPTNASLGSPSQYTLTITDDDDPPTVSFVASIATKDESDGSFTIGVGLSAASGKTVTVEYAASNITALSGSDYTATSGTLTFDPGETTKNITLPIINDSEREPNETLLLSLSSPSNASLGSPNTYTLTINDDDGSNDPPPDYFDPSVEISVATGNVHLEESLDCGCGDTAELAFNSNTVQPKPIIVAHVKLDSALAVPTDIQMRITFDNTQQSWVSFGTGGHSAGDEYVLAVQVDTPVAATGRYAYSYEIQVNFASDPTINLSGSGYENVVVNGDDGFGYGWSLKTLDRLELTNLAETGALLVFGVGGSVFFRESGGVYTNPNVPGTLVQNYDYSFTYTESGKTWNFDSSGVLQTIKNPGGTLIQTFTYANGQIDVISMPDARSFDFDYTSGRLSTIGLLGSRTVTITQDGTGHLTGIAKAENVLRTLTYDGSSKLVSDDKMGLATYTYNSLSGRAESVDRGLGGVTTVIAAITQALATATAINAADEKGIIVNPLGKTITYDFDGLLRPISKTAPDGGTEQFAYNELNQITKYTDPLSRTTTLTYASGTTNVTQIDKPDGTNLQFEYDATYNKPTVEIDAFGNRTTHAYDAGTGELVTTTDPLGNLTTYTWSSGRLESQTDQFGQRTTFLYNGTTHRLETVIDSFGQRTTTTYDGNGNPSTSTDAKGDRTTAVFDSLGRQEATVDALGNRTTTVFDGQGRAEAFVDANGNRTTSVYDDYGRVEATVDALGNRTTSVFDARGRVEETIDALGKRTTTVFDGQGRYSSTIDALNQRTTVEYDGFGRQEATVDALGRRTTTVFDSLGRYEATVDALGYRATVVYDAFGRQEANINAMTHRTTTVFDAQGRYSATIDALGQRTTVEYDGFGRQEATIDVAAQRTTAIFDSYGRYSATHDPLGNLTTVVYDQFGRQAATINPLDYRTSSVFDALNRVAATQDQLGALTTSVFDTVGNRVNVIDAVGNKTTFVYDALSREIEQIDPLGNGATFVYDALGRLESTTDRLGRRRDFSYDAAGRLVGETWINADTSTANLLTFTYDSVGNQLTAGDYDGFYTFTYDALNRVKTVANPTGQTLTMTYSPVGMRTAVQDSLGSTVISNYDALGRLQSQLLDGPTDLRVDTTYNARGQEESIVRYDDLTGTTAVARTSFVYDDAGRLTDLHHRKASDGSTIANYTYTYDSHDRLLTESLNGSLRTYSYDVTDQVTADGTTTLTYDANGNRTNTGYSTGAGNQLLSDGVWNFTYDAEGNQTKKVNIATGVTWTYGYDHLNHLVSSERQTTDGGTLEQRVEIKYDVYALRLEKKVDADGDTIFDTTQKYAYDGWNTAKSNPIGLENYDVWADLDGSGSLTTRYLRGDVVDQIFARVDGSDPYWYLTDHLGSIRDITDDTGAVVKTISYDAFGNILSQTGSGELGRYAYTGREIELELELQFNRARYYDATIGRWISRDPLGFNAGDGNLYRYVKNNQTTLTDPSGLQRLMTDAFGGFPSIFDWFRPRQRVRDVSERWNNNKQCPPGLILEEVTSKTETGIILAFDYERLRVPVTGGYTGHPAVFVGSERTGWTYLSWSTGASSRKTSDNFDIRFIRSIIGANKNIIKSTVAGSPDYEFDAFVWFRTTPEQNKKAIEWARQWEKKGLMYDLLSTNCAMISYKILQAADLPVPVYRGGGFPPVLGAQLPWDWFQQVQRHQTDLLTGKMKTTDVRMGKFPIIKDPFK